MTWLTDHIENQVMKKSGFTVIELMIAIAIVAILVALALPNYQDSVRKGRRAEAQADLLDFAGSAERVFTQTNSYTTAALPDGDKDGDGEDDYYTYSFPVAVTATTYTIRATPTAAQTADKCGTMSLNSTGLKTNTGTEVGCCETIARES